MNGWGVPSPDHSAMHGQHLRALEASLMHPSPQKINLISVSYTHLTLPTKRIV